MNDDTREKRWQDYFPRPLPRYALLACLALVVVTLGVVLTPVRPPEPAEPPFSERARAAALAETLHLVAMGAQLGTPQGRTTSGPEATSTSTPTGSSSGNTSGKTGAPSAAAGSAVERTVTLLTTQAEALLAPGESPTDTPGASHSTPPGSATSSSASSSTTSSAPPEPSPSPVPATAAGLVSALADSGRQRLADAAEADGGTARLLAAVGTAQLLQASALAEGTGTAAPPPADVAAPQVSGTCPSASAGGRAPAASGQSGQETSAAASGPASGEASEASVENALAAVARTEAQTIYGYQVAMPRLGGEAAKSAAELLARHDALLSGAASLSQLHCTAIPPREAGYTLAPSFLASPAAGLGGLEGAALPVYGDLVALSDGETRQWAIAALLASGKRAALWGTDPGALPGLDPATLPSLPSLPSLPGA